MVPPNSPKYHRDTCGLNGAGTGILGFFLISAVFPHLGWGFWLVAEGLLAPGGILAYAIFPHETLLYYHYGSFRGDLNFYLLLYGVSSIPFGVFGALLAFRRMNWAILMGVIILLYIPIGVLIGLGAAAD